jgi:hypothetical protein
VIGAGASLAEAVGGLEVKAALAAKYGELLRALKAAALLDGTIYTADSWGALMGVCREAWALVAAGAASAAGGGLEPLAVVDQAVLSMISRLNEAVLALKLAGYVAPKPPAGEAAVVKVGVAADADAVDLDNEDSAKPGFGAGFTIFAEDFYDVAYMHVTFSFDADTFDAAWELSEDLAEAGFEIESGAKVDYVLAYGNTKLVSLYIRHKDIGAIMAGGPACELLKVTLIPKRLDASYGGSLMLNHADVVYLDGAYGLSDADVDFCFGNVATVEFNVFSIYDVNRDGDVTLADVAIVRSNIGKDPGSGGLTLLRCDVNGDGRIDIADLAAVMAAYEASLS